MTTIVNILFAGLLLAGPQWFAQRIGLVQPMEKEELNDQPEAAVFAAGCFWGVEHFFAAVPGVLTTEVGYMGGTLKHPTYRQVCRGDTNHAEVVRLTFDPDRVSYETLVELFFKMHDPTTRNRQGPDIGSQYRSAVFYYSDAQHRTARAVIHRLTRQKAFRRPIVTEVTCAADFWRAEDYHQQYFKNNPARSCHITFSPAMLP